jgi:hypothetical protein
MLAIAGIISVAKCSAVHSLCHSGNRIRQWSGNRCVFAIPREFSFHSHSLKIPYWGIKHSSHNFSRQNGIFFPGAGSQCDIFFKIVKYIDTVSRRIPLFLEIKTQKKVPKILANILSDALRHPKPFFARDRAKFFQIPIALPIPSKFLQEGMSRFPTPIPS